MSWRDAAGLRRHALSTSPPDNQKSLQVLLTPDLWLPLVNLHGVHILPGILRLFKAMIEANRHLLDELPMCRSCSRQTYGCLW